MYNHEPSGYVCPMCTTARGEDTKFCDQEHVFFEDEDVMAFVSPQWWETNPGHVLVFPREHYENVYDIPDELLGKIHALGKRVALGMKKTYGCDGTSFRQHNEPAGNQHVWHYHLHVFPRWEGDRLYQEHDERRWVTSEERTPYTQKLRDYFSKASKTPA